MIALQHFSLLSPGVFPGWPGPRPPGPTRFEVLNNNSLFFVSSMIHENFPAAVQARRPALVRRRRSPAIDMAARFLHIKIKIFSYGMTSVFFQGWMGSGYNLDPAKIGQEGYNLLKYYEQQLKALQVGHTYTIIHTYTSVLQAAYLFAP